MFRIIIVLIASSVWLNSQMTKVAFIGNSMTDYKGNDAIEFLQQIIDATGDSIILKSICLNGTSLHSHIKTTPPGHDGMSKRFRTNTDDYREAETYQKFSTDTFDILFLQETPLPLLREKYRDKRTTPSFTFYDTLARNRGTRVVWMEPYCIAYDFDRYKKKKDYFADIASPDSAYEITNNYYKNELLLIDSGLTKLPVFYIINELIKESSVDLKLAIGGSHPSKISQWIIALSWYYEITGKGPEEIPSLGIFRNEWKERDLKFTTYRLFQEYHAKY